MFLQSDQRIGSTGASDRHSFPIFSTQSTNGGPEISGLALFG